MEAIPSPWREVIEEELEKFEHRDDIVAVGLAGSLSYGDIWFGSDVDLELVLKGEHTFNVLNTERENLSVDFGIFGENNAQEIPYETRPLHDPEGFLTVLLSSRDLRQIMQAQIQQNLDYAVSRLERGTKALEQDPVSARAFVHLLAWPLAEAFTLLAGDHRTIKRHVSRLERATNKLAEKGFFEEYSKLVGLPEVANVVDDLLKELELGYREIWPFFKGRQNGPRYMIQQPDSEAWFRNRILPLRKYDARDAAWIVPQEFTFVLGFLFRNLTSHERFPPNFMQIAQGFTGEAAKWVTRHEAVLRHLEPEGAPELLKAGQRLLERVKKMFTQEFLPTSAEAPA